MPGEDTGSDGQRGQTYSDAEIRALITRVVATHLLGLLIRLFLVLGNVLVKRVVTAHELGLCDQKAEEETSEASLAGAAIRFAFVQQSGRVAHDGEVTLQPVPGETGLWIGRWEGPLQLTEPCEFLFETAG